MGQLVHLRTRWWIDSCPGGNGLCFLTVWTPRFIINNNFVPFYLHGVSWWWEAFFFISEVCFQQRAQSCCTLVLHWSSPAALVAWHVNGKRGKPSYVTAVVLQETVGMTKRVVKYNKPKATSPSLVSSLLRESTTALFAATYCHVKHG